MKNLVEDATKENAIDDAENKLLTSVRQANFEIFARQWVHGSHSIESK
jgi:hypothetical protein